MQKSLSRCLGTFKFSGDDVRGFGAMSGDDGTPSSPFPLIFRLANIYAGKRRKLCNLPHPRFGCTFERTALFLRRTFLLCFSSVRLFPFPLLLRSAFASGPASLLLLTRLPPASFY